MKNIKKLLSLVLSISLLLSACLLNAAALSDADGSAIEKLTINDISIIRNTHGTRTGLDTYFYDDFHPGYTVKMRDGRAFTVSEGTAGLTIDGVETELEFSNYENDGVWEAGNTYTVTGKLKGFEVSAVCNVTIEKGPVEKIVINDTSIPKNTHGYVDNDWKYVYCYFYPGYTITMTDGRTYTVEEGETHIEIDGEIYSLVYDFPYKLTNDIWLVDQKRDVQAELCSYSVEDWALPDHGEPKHLGAFGYFHVKMTSALYTGLYIFDMEVIEGTHGYKDSDGNYIYNDFTPEFQVNMPGFRSCKSDGRSNEIEIDGQKYHLDIYEIENGGRWTTGNRYTVTAGITELYLKYTFKVSVLEDKFLNLKINDISIIEGTGGYTDGNGKYVYTDISPEVSIWDTDGNGYFGKGQIVTKGATYKLRLSDEQNETAGYWTVGNTYTVTGILLGRSAEFNVNIIESPIEKIEIDDVSMIENTHGYRKADYHYYYESIFPDVTVTMRDGNKFKTHCGEIWLNTVRYDLEVETGQDTTDGPWTLGNTYKVKGKLLGAECDFNVSIIENPVEEFTVYDMELNESELWSRSYYPGANTDKMRYEVKLKDGNVIKSKLSEQGVTIGVDTGIEYDYQQQVVCIDGIYYVPSFDACSFGKAGDDIVGDYTAKASFFSVDTTYTITVTRSKLKSLEIKDYTLIDGVGSRSVQPDFTVVLDDGRRINSYKWGNAKFVNVDGVLLSIYPDSINDRQPGQTYKVKARVGNITGEFNLTVEENPIKDVELVKGPDKTIYYDGEYFNPVGAVMRINYKDGSHEDISITESSLQLEKAVLEIDRTGVVAKCRSNRMNLETTLYCPTDDYGIGGSFFRMHGGIWLQGVGDREMVMKLFGYEVTCRITVRENDWDTVTADAGEWAPVLNVTHNDGSETEVRLNDVVLMRGEYVKEGTRLIAGVFTDKGVYNGAVIVNKDGTYSIEIEGKTVLIGKNGWLKGKIAVYSGSLGDLNGDGKINATDALLALQLAVGKSGLDAEKQQLADVDNSGSVTATDSLLILQMAVGKIDRF